MASCNTPTWPRQPGSLGSVVADVTAVLHLSCVWNSPRCPEKPLDQLRQGLPVKIASCLQGPISPNPASWNLSALSTWGRKWHHRCKRNTAGALTTLKRRSSCLCCGGTVNIPLPGLCTVSCVTGLELLQLNLYFSGFTVMKTMSLWTFFLHWILIQMWMLILFQNSATFCQSEAEFEWDKTKFS